MIKETDPAIRAVILENMQLLRGKRTFIGEHATAGSEPLPRPDQAPATANHDVLDVLRAEVTAAVGPLSQAWIEQFASELF